MAFFSTKTYGGERGLSCAMRAWTVSVECFEHGANSAIYQNPQTVLRQVSAEALAAMLKD